MLLLAVIGGLLLAIGLLVRERVWGRQCRHQETALRELRAALEKANKQLTRTCEDVFVLQVLLAERNLVDEAALAHGRVRLVEIPRRLARERRAIMEHLCTNPTQLILGESEGKIH